MKGCFYKIIKNLSKFSHKNQNQEIHKIQNQPGSSMDQPTLDLIIEMRKDYDKLMNPNQKGVYLRQDIF